MVILPIVFVFILPQLTFGLKICDHGTKTDKKCPIYLEKETTCTCKEVTKPKKQYQMKYFHQHEKENSNWLKISCEGIGPIQMLRNDSSYQNKTEMNTTFRKYKIICKLCPHVWTLSDELSHYYIHTTNSSHGLSFTNLESTIFLNKYMLLFLFQMAN